MENSGWLLSLYEFTVCALNTSLFCIFNFILIYSMSHVVINLLTNNSLHLF